MIERTGSLKLVAGLALLSLLALVFVFGPILSGLDPTDQDLTRIEAPPSYQSWFGTDELGRDLFVRLAYGGRQSLVTAFAAGLTTLAVGAGIGALAGLFRKLDGVLVQVVDLIVSISNWSFVLVVAPWFLGIPGGVGILFGIVSADRVARIVRSHIQAMLANDVILAAVVSGSTKLSLFRRHFWPRLSGVVAAELVFVMALSSAFEVTLGFLQFGDKLSLGLALHDAKGSVTDETSRMIIPALLLMMILLSFYLISRGVAQLRPDTLGQDHGASTHA